MLIVDTNVWAGYFNGELTAHVERLDHALSVEEDVAILPVIVTELLQGFRSEHGFKSAKELLQSIPFQEPSIQTYVEAAGLYRGLRARGVTIRGAVDCIIAQFCMDLDVELLSPDADFRQIAKHAPLRLCEV